MLKKIKNKRNISVRNIKDFLSKWYPIVPIETPSSLLEKKIIKS